ncbi:uncharacterized protein TNCV_4782691 [Trichonephila clavipes]|nr:uncharacterized protein TNCV_4782691 [Trichonephila clavipes]
MCELNEKREHVCSNYKGSSGNMEAGGAFRVRKRTYTKRVGSRLKETKEHQGLGGKGKLTDKLSITTELLWDCHHSNVGCLEKMQSAVIAAFFHCCSSNQIPCMGSQQGKDSWCKYKQALSDGEASSSGHIELCHFVLGPERTKWVQSDSPHPQQTKSAPARMRWRQVNIAGQGGS